MDKTNSLVPISVIKESYIQENIMSFLKKEDLLTYCICDFMLCTGNDLKNTLLLTFEKLYVCYQRRLVPVTNLYADNRLIYLDETCGLLTILNEELSAHIMNSYKGIMTDYVFTSKGSSSKAINRSFMSKKIGSILEKAGYLASASLFKNTFGYSYFCKYRTLIGSPFSYLCYRKEQIMKAFSLSEDEYCTIMSKGISLEEKYQTTLLASKIHMAYEHIMKETPEAPAAVNFLEELSILIESYD